MICKCSGVVRQRFRLVVHLYVLSIRRMGWISPRYMLVEIQEVRALIICVSIIIENLRSGSLRIDSTSSIEMKRDAISNICCGGRFVRAIVQGSNMTFKGILKSNVTWQMSILKAGRFENFIWENHQQTRLFYHHPSATRYKQNILLIKSIISYYYNEQEQNEHLKNTSCCDNVCLNYNKSPRLTAMWRQWL